MSRRRPTRPKKAKSRPHGLRITDIVLSVAHVDKLNRLHQTILQNSRVIAHVINGVIEHRLSTPSKKDAAFGLLDAAERLTTDNITVLDNIEMLLVHADAASTKKMRRAGREKGGK